MLLSTLESHIAASEKVFQSSGLRRSKGKTTRYNKPHSIICLTIELKRTPESPIGEETRTSFSLELYALRESSHSPGSTLVLMLHNVTSTSLSITGIFYDEVIPTAAELAGFKDGKPHLPPSCENMFATLWHITSKSKSSYITFEEWCRSWFRVVLPLRDLGCIRPSVFKPASQLASGRRVSLAIPVLTCIYKAFQGANAVKMLARKDAKSSICSGDINRAIVAPDGSTNVNYIDDGVQSQQIADFFFSVRSCCLALRHNSNSIIKPYSPHRFSRQFGFYQDVPDELKPPLEKITRKYLYSLFQTSVRVGTQSSFVIPARGLKMKSRATDSYTSWWKPIYSSSVSLSNLPSPPKPSEGRDVIGEALLVNHSRMESFPKIKIELYFKDIFDGQIHALKPCLKKKKKYVKLAA
ncbi:Glutamyl-tRNA(Gln) amidotransferase subunit D [Bienertia sinuspersici]